MTLEVTAMVPMTMLRTRKSTAGVNHPWTALHTAGITASSIAAAAELWSGGGGGGGSGGGGDGGEEEGGGGSERLFKGEGGGWWGRLAHMGKMRGVVMGMGQTKWGDFSSKISPLFFSF